MNNTTRIATVKATGMKYLVQRLYIPTQTNEVAKVYCWGECVGTRGAATRHEESKIFTREAVEIAEVQKTEALANELFNQALRAKRAAGIPVRVSRSRR